MKLLAMVDLPLYVHTTKSHTKKGKVIFNLNNYRNMFHNKNNTAKKEMAKIIRGMSIPYLGLGPFKLVYTYYHGNKAKVDIANPCSVIDKFTCDSITSLGLWPDDNRDYVQEVVYKWGGVNPGAGFCQLKIYEI